MCEPTTIAAITLAVSAASAAASLRQGQLTAAKQENAYNRGLEQTNIQLNERMTQERAQAAAKISERARAGMLERGRLAAASDFGGDYGRANLESFFNQNQDIATIQANAAGQRRQSLLEQQGAAVANQGNVNTIKRPSLIDAGLQIGAAGTDFAGTYRRYNPTAAKPGGNI